MNWIRSIFIKSRPRVSIRIDNLTGPQLEALEDMLATWMHLGGLGSSRWTAFFADGDGNFHPRITVNGKKPKFTEKLERKDLWVKNLDCSAEYRIDFDALAWKTHE